MSITLAQTLSAVGPGITSSFGASGGSTPYVYSVRPNGAGGTIDSASGLYTAPALVPSNAAKLYDTIVATDALGAVATAKILIGDALLLFCDVIQTGMGLPNGRVYLWDQKIFQPHDDDIYVAVSVLSCKPFGNTNEHASSDGGLVSNQSINMAAMLQVDIISRGPAARMQKEGVLIAINSDYAEQQQNANGFYIGKLPPGAQFINLSMQDGAAIPYRFTINVMIQYVYALTQPVGYMIPTPGPVINYVQS